MPGLARRLGSQPGGDWCTVGEMTARRRLRGLALNLLLVVLSLVVGLGLLELVALLAGIEPLANDRHYARALKNRICQFGQLDGVTTCRRRATDSFAGQLVAAVGGPQASPCLPNCIGMNGLDPRLIESITTDFTHLAGEAGVLLAPAPSGTWLATTLRFPLWRCDCGKCQNSLWNV